MRGKKKKGALIKPSTDAKIAAAMLEKLKENGINLNN